MADPASLGDASRSGADITRPGEIAPKLGAIRPIPARHRRPFHRHAGWPARAGRAIISTASVDPTEARNRRALTTPNVAISRCLEADETADRLATPEQV
jgi:hypothetical protein